MDRTLADMTPEQQLAHIRTQLEEWRGQLDKRIKFGDYLGDYARRDQTTRTRITAILDGVKQ